MTSDIKAGGILVTYAKFDNTKFTARSVTDFMNFKDHRHFLRLLASKSFRETSRKKLFRKSRESHVIEWHEIKVKSTINLSPQRCEGLDKNLRIEHTLCPTFRFLPILLKSGSDYRV